MSSIREGILLDIVEVLAARPEIKGVIDDVPFDYAHPPRPRPSHGKQAHPFAYVFEGEEMPNSDETSLAQCDLQVTVEVTYEYSKTDGARGMKPTGRALLAAIQTALMADPNRGSQALTSSATAVKRAQRTRELFNAIEETAVDGLGVVVTRWGVQYLRDFQDPNNR